jgi:proteasome accessory factor B
LLGLVVCLLSTRRYLTADQIRAAVPGYPEQDELFKRMFERDKEDLRDLGVPLETGLNHPFDEDPGYRILQQAYELPELHLEADEAAVLGLAARVWERAKLAGAAAGALMKLQAAGIDPARFDSGDERADGAGPAAGLIAPGIEPRLGTPEPAFGPLWEAVRDRRPVSFSYRTPGRADPQRRELEPWGVVNRHGRWYVAGWDRARQDTRVFRLSRIAGPVKFGGPAGRVRVPDDVDVRELVRDRDSTPVAERTALLRVRAGTGVGLRQHAASVEPDAEHPGWDLVSTRFAEVAWFADQAASFGPDAVVLDPPDLRDAVIRRLKGALA